VVASERYKNAAEIAINEERYSPTIKNVVAADAFGDISDGNIGEFVREELTTRKELGYPPFRTLIKFTYRGSEEEGRRALSDLERIFSVYHPVTFPSFIGKVKGKYVMNALLFVPREDPKSAWPNDEILSLIRSLPPEIEVRVNPDSVV
jgi:primosomal protein N'